jgi:hypothetical protein
MAGVRDAKTTPGLMCWAKTRYIGLCFVLLIKVTAELDF